MQFIYHSKSGDDNIIVEGDEYKHVFHSRRERANKLFTFSNMRDSTLYFYKISEITKKYASFYLESSYIKSTPLINTHIIQSVINMREFSKILPCLNELMVAKITLFYSDFSQKNEKINLDRLNKILINSSMQCGRLHLLDIEVLEDLKSVLTNYPNALAFDFDSGLNIKFADLDSIIIGPEGGFSKHEKELLKNRSFSISLKSIMKSITASVFIASCKIIV